MPNGEHGNYEVPDSETLRMLKMALDGLGKVMDFDPLAPQALIAAETLMSMTRDFMPVPEQDLADRWG